MYFRSATLFLLVILCGFDVSVSSAQLLDKRQMLAEQTFWDNRDWDWYEDNIPFFECPDREINTTYYYRWELLTKHLTYTAPNYGYTFTEFIDRPFWSGAYGAISCPAGHQLYEARWLRKPQIAQDFGRYWFRTPGAQPRNYSTWLADSIWATFLAHGDANYAMDLLPDLIANYEGWEQRHYVPEVGLFWQTGHDDGMEFNINSRQTQDILRGAPGYRPSFNSYMWADAVAISRIAELAGNAEITQRYKDKAAALKLAIQTQLWDADREFFFPMSKNEEKTEDGTVKAQTLTYESGKFAGNTHGRELIGYVPWQFNLPDANPEFENAWRFLISPEYFAAPFGPTTVERNDPQFLLKNSCCWWSGQSWPYATTQTLKALANYLQNYAPESISQDDYIRMLHTFAISHRKDGKPYLAEALHPDTGSFEGHDAYNHSEHYFHSGFSDLIITGLIGLQPQNDNRLEIKPLAPSSWEYFAIDDLNYHGHRLSIAWDKSGKRYGKGQGLYVLVDGQQIAHSPTLGPLLLTLPPENSPINSALNRPSENLTDWMDVNFAVNNDGDYFPQVTASHTGINSSPSKLIDGNYWYHLDPPNRWTSAGSMKAVDWIEVDLGLPRTIHTLKLYFLSDDRDIKPPERFLIEHWTDDQWQSLPTAKVMPVMPTGRRANVIQFDEMELSKFRVTLTHAAGAKSGLTEIEAWGKSKLPVVRPPAPTGNIAFNNGQHEFPKVSASHTSRFDKITAVNDGRIIYTPTPNNRWTSYESKQPSDWLEIDFGAEKAVGRVVLHIFDDRGGVQAPQSYDIEGWDGTVWKGITSCSYSPEKPTGGVPNSVRFEPVKLERIRVVFHHRGQARSGLTEIEVWEK